MPDFRRANCQTCGRHRDEVGGISWSGLCRDCALHAVGENLEALETKSGYNYRVYLRGMARWIEQATLDAGGVSAQTGGHNA